MKVKDKAERQYCDKMYKNRTENLCLSKFFSNFAHGLQMKENNFENAIKYKYSILMN